MFESLTTEVILVSAIVGASALALVGSLVILLTSRPERPKVDVEAAVRNAPYHRLRDVLPVKDD